MLSRISRLRSACLSSLHLCRDVGVVAADPRGFRARTSSTPRPTSSQFTAKIRFSTLIVLPVNEEILMPPRGQEFGY